MINLENIKKARELLSPEIQDNLNLSGTKEYQFLLESAGILDSLIRRLESGNKS